MQLLHKYLNGNVQVSLFSDGTKYLECQDAPVYAWPCNLDLKLTDFCNAGCFFCFENSTTKGKHGNLVALMQKLEGLPSGTELSLGGGDPLSHPDIVQFLQEVKGKGWIANLTVNQVHLHSAILDAIIAQDLVQGIGISIADISALDFARVNSFAHPVFHVIAGVHDVTILEKLVAYKTLILGYKTFGRGIKYHSPEVDANIANWFRKLPFYLGRNALSFDNLAIEQLQVQRLLTKEGWEEFYMGDDGIFSMYIDAVKGQFAKTSRTHERTDWNAISLQEFFHSL